MKLSELNIEKILKDREFNWLGLTAEEYTGKEVLTFLTDEKYISEIIANNSISCVITTTEIAEKIKDLNYGILISENPRKTFFELHNKLVDEDFYFKKEKNNISSKAIISSKASIREYNINIEDDVVIEENVVIYPNVTIKKGSIIRANSTIGGNAFEFSRFGDEVLSIKSAGKVLIEENVEVQNNNTVDKGVFGATILHKNVKTDNLVHIGHDVIVGENTFLTACTEISGRVKIGKNAYFGPNCTIRNGIKIGENNISSKAIISSKASIREYNINIEDDVVIEENVVIYPNVTIKKGSIIRANSTIGGNAFEFSRFGDEVLSIKSAGKVLIEENVEVQNNNTVDKGVFGATILHKNVKTDNLVHIGHDVIVGENTFLTACTEISGRVKIGKNAYFGPNCTIRNGIKIGENSKITMGAVVTKDVKDDEVVTGNFAILHKKYLKVLKFLLNEVEKNEL